MSRSGPKPMLGASLTLPGTKQSLNNLGADGPSETVSNQTRRLKFYRFNIH